MEGSLNTHAEALRSIIALTDENGTVRTQYNYTPFGDTEMIGEASENPFQYTGRENDGTGLHYYRARYYSPEMGRFISEDPIGLAGGINFYSYTGNSPVNWVDPLGLFEFVYEAGGSIWFPGSAGAYSGEVGSKWKSPYSEGPQYRGYSDNFTIASLADIGARAGIKGLSGCDKGRETSVNVGLGKYLGFQIHFRNGRFDGITTGFGIGLSSPVTYSVPFEDFISAYD